MRNLTANVLAFVLAGGRGQRLYPLTSERTKPSVPFGGKYRIIDFTLSNLVNSGIYSTYVLVQYKSQSLIEHIRTCWRKFGVLPRHFITVVPPQMRREETREWYRGTADSIYQNINLIYDFKPKYVAIFGGDHIYRMDIKAMIDYHIKKKSQLTIAVMPVESSQANQLGVVDVDSDLKVKKFYEKPSISFKKTIFASMGNYIFDADFLVQALNKYLQKKNINDFGKDIIPYLVKEKSRIFAYDFSQNKIPNLKNYEAKYYWRDVGSIASYWQANMDLLGRKPCLNLDNRYWPIYASNLYCPGTYTTDAKIQNSIICEGTKIFGSTIKNSIIGRSVIIEDGCFIEDSIIMDFTWIKKSCRIRKTIVDRFNTVPARKTIGYNAASDEKTYHCDPSGIVVVARGLRSFDSYIRGT